jgi:phosphatidylserine/phosphatidylglycerophosphate/cardiolipin synthase-like enzyme
MNCEIEFITDADIYSRILFDRVPNASSFLWLATSDLKDLYTHKGNRMVPFLEVISDLIKKGIAVRLIHAKEPGPAFREDFDRYPSLTSGLERLLCPRVHFKCVIIDGTFAYSGSANLTGAGMGAKSDKRRNFESGIITTDKHLIAPVMEQFDAVWMGKFCGACQRTEYCPDRPEMIS